MFNKVLMIGRLSKDPEAKTTPTGIAVTTFNIAVQRNYAKDGKYETDFFNCVAYRKTAEFVARYFKKGNEILIEGRLENRTYEKDGQKRYITEINVETVSFVGKRETESNGDNPNINVSEDDLPF